MFENATWPDTAGAWLLARYLRARRGRCLRRGHPEADWAPVVMSTTGPATMAADGTIIDGETYEVHAYRCAVHDRKP